MNRFNAILALFVILLVAWLIEQGPPRSRFESVAAELSDIAPTAEPEPGITVRSFEIRFNSDTISATLNDDGEWQNIRMPPNVDTAAVASFIDEMIADFQQLTTFSVGDNLSQFGLNNGQHQYEVRFEYVLDEESDEVRSFAFLVGNATASRREFYAVFIDVDTGGQVPGWVYTVPAQYIEQLDSLVSILTNQSQPEGQRTVP